MPQEINVAVRIIIYGLAVYRLTSLLVRERGPFDIFDWLRAKVGIRVVITPIITHQYDASCDCHRQTQVEQRRVEAEGFLAGVFACPWCLSVWLAAVAVVFAFIQWLPADIVAAWLAIAAISRVLFPEEM